MKKNVIGHMVAAKEPVVVKLRRWNLLPKFFCLLFALVIWLAVTNLNLTDREDLPSDSDTEVTDS